MLPNGELEILRPIGRPRMYEKKVLAIQRKKNVFFKGRIQGIAVRFFWVLDVLVESGSILNIHNFCKNHFIESAGFIRLRSAGDRAVVPSDYLSLLADLYGVNGIWLLTGDGEMFPGYEEKVEALTGYANG